MNVIRTSLILGALALVAGCAGKNDLDELGGQRITRSVCPAIAIPTYTGDVTMFSPAQSRDARALDVSASITNLRSSCDDSGAMVQASVTFDVVGQRASRSGARDVVLPYFSTVMRGGSQIVSKQVGRVQLHFDDGQVRGTGQASASAEINRGSASLPADVATQLNRKRKATDADASIDPMGDPRIRSAVNQASFELLLGFELTQEQLAYNATR